MVIETPKDHAYTVTITWTGDKGSGTSAYRAYARQHEITALGKPAISASSDPAFRGDPARYNPEELLVASLSACHMLWYLHLCSVNGVVVTAYEDCADGFMHEQPGGEGKFTEVVLQPEIVLAPGSDVERAHALHEEANAKCFIANSVNFPVRHEPVIRIAAKAQSAAQESASEVTPE